MKEKERITQSKPGEDIQGIYRHYKGGRYEVLGYARHTESDEELVVYRPLDPQGDSGLPDFWVRPKAMFFEEVQIDGKPCPRFQKF